MFAAVQTPPAAGGLYGLGKNPGIGCGEHRARESNRIGAGGASSAAASAPA
jgi:hypothetical protein